MVSPRWMKLTLGLLQKSERCR